MEARANFFSHAAAPAAAERLCRIGRFKERID
jgi:hypothetical protein